MNLPEELLFLLTKTRSRGFLFITRLLLTPGFKASKFDRDVAELWNFMDVTVSSCMSLVDLL
jgi:hypothetical protein